jgi:hypothetical protein
LLVADVIFKLLERIGIFEPLVTDKVVDKLGKTGIGLEKL